MNMATPTTHAHAASAATTTSTATEHWLRAGAAADYLDVSAPGLQELKHAGLPYHRVASHNGLCLFLVSEIDQWMRNRQDVPRTPPRDERRPRYQMRCTAHRTTTTTTPRKAPA